MNLLEIKKKVIYRFNYQQVRLQKCIRTLKQKNMKTEYKHFMNSIFVKIENGKSVFVYLDVKIEYYDYILDSFSDYEKSTEAEFLNAVNKTIFTLNSKLINGL